MGNKMEKNLENLNQIFNKKIFRIPDFQRGYSWGKEQLDDFWGDIELLSENEVHYTGLLTYEKIKKLKDADDIKLKEKYSKFTTIKDQRECFILRHEIQYE